MQEKRKIYRVSEITRRIKTVLEADIGHVWIEGELSNVRQPSSGHLYFTLKDEGAQIQSALFRGRQRNLAFQVKDGLKVRVYGQITVYERNGQYQIIVEIIEEAGKGSLQEAFEALKKKLAAEGLFDEARKKPIPLLPRHVGLVTSSTGAALRDILNILTRRFPNLHIVLAPVKVQGAGAAEEIAAAIDRFNQWGRADVLIVGRGGGSLEDLWSFNEEIVARAIARSGIPVISAVGHEIDFTISDFVADLRAPTPSAAAELVVGQKEAFEQHLLTLSRQLARSLRTFRLELKNRFIAASRSYVFRQPENLVKQHRQRLETYRLNLTHLLRGAVRERQQRIDDSSVKLLHRMESRHKGCLQDARRLDAQLRAFNPAGVLQRGYSITQKADGSVVRSSDEVMAGDALETRVARGTIHSIVD